MPAQLAAPPPGYREDFLEDLGAGHRAASLKELAAGMTPAEVIEEIIGIQPAKAAAFNAGATTWLAWNGTTCSSTATTNNVTWESWNSSTTGSAALYNTTTGTVTWVQPNWTSWNASYEETAEQKAARERAREERLAREAEAAARMAEEQAERQRASERAVELLLSLLSDEQAATYREHGWFEVRGSSGRRWRIRNRGQSGNVDLMPEIGEERDATYCAHPPGHLPDADAHVAQMLALVTDDEAFERTANVHWRNPARQPPFMRAVA